MAEPLISPTARWFVGVLFVLIGLSFIISTASIVYEFSGANLDFVLSSSSNLFIYFPTFGLVALAAFYVPATIFTDLYWRNRVGDGPLRFLLGLIGVLVLTYFATHKLTSLDRRPVWELAPWRLAEDAARPGQCTGAAAANCPRPLLSVALDLRKKAQSHLRLSPLVRNCEPDDLIEAAADYETPRYCFATGTKLGTAACCSAQSALQKMTYASWQTVSNRSIASVLDHWFFLPIKCFFVIVIVVIGILLIIRRKKLVEFYNPLLPAMERSLQIGALAMLPWLLMDYAQQHTADLLYGTDVAFPPRISLILIPWSLLIGFYFADRIKLEFVRAVQAVGAVFSIVAFFKVRDAFDYSAKAMGHGASYWNFALIGIVCLFGLGYFVRWIPGALRGEDKGDIEQAPDKPAAADVGATRE